MGLPLQGGILPQVRSYPKEDCNPPLVRIPPNFGQPPWGALPRKVKGVWAPMVLSKNLWNLPGPSRTILGHSGTFWDGFGMFRNLLDYFRNLLGLFWDVPELSG